MNWHARADSWSFIFFSFLPRLTLCSLAWETAQLPLYSLWDDPRPGTIVFAIAHCTVGDAMIGAAALVMALILSGAGERSHWPRRKICALMVILAIAYTLASERMNLAQGNWSYSAWMPVLPWIKVGLAPVLQWIVVPMIAWTWASRRAGSAH